MITDTDIKKLKKVFATKDDLKDLATKKDLQVYATKKDLQAHATKKDLQQTSNVLTNSLRTVTSELVELIHTTHKETVKEIVGEIRAMRLEIGAILTNHQDRIVHLENKPYS